MSAPHHGAPFKAGPPPQHIFVSNAPIQQPLSGPAAKYHEVFLEGKPKALGIVMILAAILLIILGLILRFMYLLYWGFVGIIFWGPIIYIVTGSLSIAAAQSHPNPGLIRGSLAMNIITSIVSAIAFILSAVAISVLAVACPYQSPYCTFIHVSLGLEVAILILYLLIFCLSLSTSVFGCRSLKHVVDVQQVCVIQNTAAH